MYFNKVTCHTQQDTYSPLLHSQLADVYGNVFCIRLGRHKTVFVSGWKMVKEALVTQADNFVDRPYSPMVTRIYSGNSGQYRNMQHISVLQQHLSSQLSYVLWFHSFSAGLFFSNGTVWRRQRRFAMTTLRTFSLAKSSMEQSICDESHQLQEAMEKEKGRRKTKKRTHTHTHT